MITTIKLTKHIKIQRYKINGLKIFLIYRKKWIMIKLTENQVKLLQFILNVLIGSK